MTTWGDCSLRFVRPVRAYCDWTDSAGRCPKYATGQVFDGDEKVGDFCSLHGMAIEAGTPYSGRSQGDG